MTRTQIIERMFQRVKPIGVSSRRGSDIVTLVNGYRIKVKK